MPNLNILHYQFKNFLCSNEDGSITVRLFSNLKNISELCLVYGSKHDLFKNGRNREKMNIEFENSYSYVWSTTVLLTTKKDYMYYFELIIDNSKFIFTSLGLEKFREDNTINCFQLCHVFECEKTIVPRLAKEKGVVIQIMPDRFDIGDKNNLGMKFKNLNFNEKPFPTSYFGGDLKGIENRIYYLKLIGVSTIYLTPIFKSTCYHRYDVEDYFKIDDRLGGDKALLSLVKEVHKNNMNIVLDAVFNHTSFYNPMFQDVIKNGEKSKFYNYYFCDGTPDFEKGNYLTFSHARHMPKLDTSNPEVINYCCKAISFIQNKFDIDGWRFDVGDEIAHSFITQIKKTLRSIKKDILIIGEDWQSSENFIEGEQFDGVMNYPLCNLITSLLVDERIDSKTFCDWSIDLLCKYSWNNSLCMFNFISSHDIPRFLSLVNNKDKTLLATLIAISFPGMFMSYYGDEFGMPGGKDPDNRRPIDWNNEPSDKNYFKNYCELLNLKQIEEFISGKFYIKDLDGMIEIRRYINEDNVYKILMNITDKTREVKSNKNIILSHKYNSDVLDGLGYLVYLDNK